MRRLYYYSKSDLSYRAIGGARLSLVVITLMFASSLMTMFSGYFGLDLFGLKSLRADSMARENAVLKAQLASLNDKLDNFKLVIGKLGKSDDQLRTSVNLPLIPEDVRKVAVGGVEINRDYGVPADANKLIASASNSLYTLEREAKLQEQSYEQILSKYKSNQELFAHIPAIDPIRHGTITDGFGMRFHPILHMLLMHEGIDIACPAGSHVHATGDGVVTYVGRRGGYGNVVEIDNGFGYSTLFAHLEKPLVSDGQKVKRGQIIALSGDTGLSTGPHLHYGVMKNGVFVDPSGYFFEGPEYKTRALYGGELAQK
ncbi:MAG: M23 family metallopeptidase [Bacteroidetes bacterium]|nr:M23 family metallopeptidase [Bacteroidota bacterium]